MIARLRLDGGHHILYDRPQRTEHRAECIERPWRVRGVPTPKSVRLHRPRLKTPACTSRCFQHVLVPACAPADRRGRPVGDGGHGFRSMHAKSARVGVAIPEAFASFVRNSS